MAKKDIKFCLEGNSVLFDELVRVINRAADTAKQLHSRDKRRRDPDLKIILNLQQTLGRNTSNSTLFLSRSDIRLIQAILIGLSSNLYTNIIPNYKHRIEKEPDNAAHYEPYIKRCEERILLYKELLDIIQEKLT